MSDDSLRTLEITPEMCAAIEALGQAMKHYAPGRMSSAVIDLPKLALADATLAAIRAQLIRIQVEAQRRAALRRVPKAKPAPVPVVEVELRRKRRKKSA